VYGEAAPGGDPHRARNPRRNGRSDNFRAPPHVRTRSRVHARPGDGTLTSVAGAGDGEPERLDSRGLFCSSAPAELVPRRAAGLEHSIRTP